MKEWHNPELTVLDISETAEKKDEAWATWECPNKTCDKTQNWGQCKNCGTYRANATGVLS